MYKILMISHGPLAQGFYNTMKMILGVNPDIVYCALEEGDSNEVFDTKIKDIVNWENDTELLILVDVFSGSPCRSAITKQLSSNEKKSCLIAGMNLPLIMEAYTNRSMKLAEIVDTLVSVARENVMNVNEVWKNERNIDDE